MATKVKRAVARRPAQKPSKVTGINIPKTQSHQIFCRQWLLHYDHNRAAEEAGLSEKNVKRGSGVNLFRRYRDYLMAAKEKKEAAVAKELALDQKDILKEMMAIAFANAQDYIEEVEVEEKDEKTGEVRRVRRHRQKLLTDLTRAQAAAVSKVTFHAGGHVTYEIPDERSKHPYLKDLGQHLGLFHPKLIQEHRHAHTHKMLSYQHMDMQALKQAEMFYIKAIGPDARRALGITDYEEGEFTEVARK